RRDRFAAQRSHSNVQIWRPREKLVRTSEVELGDAVVHGYHHVDWLGHRCVLLVDKLYSSGYMTGRSNFPIIRPCARSAFTFRQGFRCLTSQVRLARLKRQIASSEARPTGSM